MPGDLHYGDNLDILRHKIASESVDLIYLDPPFNSDRTYNVLHKGSQAQSEAFVDTWTWDDKSERAFRELTDQIPPGVRVPRELTEMMLALRSFLGDRRDMLAYLSMMAIRLVEMHRVLRKTGTLYLHCDPTASHYLKVALDAIFGADRFENEIVWQRSTGKSLSTKRLPTNHDTLLVYRRGDAATWNSDAMFTAYDPENLDEKTLKKYCHFEPDGRRYRLGDITNPNPDRPNLTYEFMGHTKVWRWTKDRMLEAYERGVIVQPSPGAIPCEKRYLDERKGKPLSDVWTDIPPLNSQAAERLGYPTQKPLALLQRILTLSSNGSDVVLDPFCGCGTTVEAAEHLGRKWIGIDIAIRAVDIIKDRLDEKFTPRVWTEHGEPADVDQAVHLAETNPYDFQWWAVRHLGGRPPKGEKKKGGDGGIDGELTIRDDGGTDRHGIVSVKGGRTLTPDMVKALKSTVDLQKADFGVLVTMHEPSRGMRDVARDFGPVSWASKYDGKVAHRVRIVTVPEIMSKQVQWPGRLERPRTQSAPPPPEAREGETLRLPFAPSVPQIKRAKVRPPGTSKARPYETPATETKVVAEKGSKPPRK